MLDELRIAEMKSDGGDVTVNWYYDKDDADMEEILEDFMLEIGMKINFVSF